MENYILLIFMISLTLIYFLREYYTGHIIITLLLATYVIFLSVFTIKYNPFPEYQFTPFLYALCGIVCGVMVIVRGFITKQNKNNEAKDNDKTIS